MEEEVEWKERRRSGEKWGTKCGGEEEENED